MYKERNSNKYYDLINNSLIFAIGNFGSKIITFFLVPVYTGFLSTSEYGTADLVVNISNLILPIVSLTIQDSIIRFGVSDKNRKETILKNSLFVFLLGCFALLLIYPLLNLYKEIKEWKIFVLELVIFNNLNNIFLSYSKAKNKNKLFALSGILSTLVLAITNIILICFFKTGVKGYLTSNIVSLLVSSIILFIGTNSFKDIRNSKIDYPLLKQMIAYSSPLIINNLSWWILNSSNRIVIEKYFGVSELGLYTAASKIPNLLAVLSSIFSSAWTISSIKAYDNKEEKSFYSNIFCYYSIFLSISVSFILMIVKKFSSFYLQKEFIEGWTCTPFLLIGMLFYSYSSFYGGILGALKKNVVTSLSTILSSFLNVLLSVFLIPKMGIMGASFSLMISYIFISLVRMLYIHRHYNFYFNKKKFLLSNLLLFLQTIIVIKDIYNCNFSLLIVITLILINIKELYLLKDFVIVKLIRVKDEKTRKKRN